jgi:amino-acid N-acetyltransferase
MIAQVVTRQAEASEAAAIRALLAAGSLPTADITARSAPWFLLAVEGDGVIGTVAVEPCGSFGLLRSLAVRPEQRGQGIGRRLVAEAEERAEEARLHGLYLLTTTARHFFAALGYDELEHWELPEAIRDTEEYRALCPKTATAMMKRLR